MKARRTLLPLVVFSVGVPLYANVSVQLTAPTSTIAVGQTLSFTATAQDSAASATYFSYQFTVRPHNNGQFSVMKDYYWTNTFYWTPTDYEGYFDIGVTAHSGVTGAYGSAETTVYVGSRVTGSAPAVSGTNNALVALFSAPACSAPGQMRVRFRPISPSSRGNSVYTPYKDCNGLSMNFYIGGMIANTAYTMQDFLYSDSGVTSGPSVTYTTGSVPSNVNIKNHFRLAGPAAPTSVFYPYLLHGTISSTPFATDLDENVVWYLAGAIPNDTGYLTHPIAGGTFLIIQDDRAASALVCPPGASGSCGDHQFLREFDMAGNAIRETSWTHLNTEMNNLRASQGKSSVRLSYISHEGIRLPNGYTVTMVTDEQVKNSNSGPKDYLGDAIVVLDNNWQVVWTWDVFDYFDVNRQTVGGACAPNGPGCPPHFYNVQANGQPYSQAGDFSHGNSIFYDSSDGNFILSFRDQSWVVKVNYANGAGDGHILWKLGYGGSFQLPAGYPVTDWFSGQHDPEIEANGLLTLFDNNNASSATQQPGGTAHGQAWQLDTVRNIATPVENIDLEVGSSVVGSAVLLSNGNYEWQAGYVDNSYAQTLEFTPSGTLVYKEQSDSFSYRSFRLRDLYTP